MVEQKQLTQYLNKLLCPQDFSDFGPNGLQIDGNKQIKKVAFSVSATVDSINQAVEIKADTLIVHHGLFWKFNPTRPLVPPFSDRVFPLIRNNINLYGYHLPLDAQLEMGNASSLAKKIGMNDLQPFGEHKNMPLGVKGKLNTPVSVDAFKKNLEEILNHQVIVSSNDEKANIKSVGIITGGANNEWHFALEDGLDAYITGEISEYNWHDAKEAGMHMFAGGHNATEEFGIQSLMEILKKEFSLECTFIPSNNPA